MSRLWACQGCHNIRIITTENKSFCGYPVVVNDEDETESGEVELTLELSDGTFVGFADSEIKTLDILN